MSLVIHDLGDAEETLCRAKSKARRDRSMIMVQSEDNAYVPETEREPSG